MIILISRIKIVIPASPPYQPVQELEKVEKPWCCQPTVVDSISINYKKLVSTAVS